MLNLILEEDNPPRLSAGYRAKYSPRGFSANEAAAVRRRLARFVDSPRYNGLLDLSHRGGPLQSGAYIFWAEGLGSEGESVPAFDENDQHDPSVPIRLAISSNHDTITWQSILSGVYIDQTIFHEILHSSVKVNEHTENLFTAYFSGKPGGGHPSVYLSDLTDLYNNYSDNSQTRADAENVLLDFIEHDMLYEVEFLYAREQSYNTSSLRDVGGRDLYKTEVLTNFPGVPFSKKADLANEFESLNRIHNVVFGRYKRADSESGAVDVIDEIINTAPPAPIGASII